jgi:hypothetical protein
MPAAVQDGTLLAPPMVVQSRPTAQWHAVPALIPPGTTQQLVTGGAQAAEPSLKLYWQLHVDPLNTHAPPATSLDPHDVTGAAPSLHPPVESIVHQQSEPVLQHIAHAVGGVHDGVVLESTSTTLHWQLPGKSTKHPTGA